MKLTKVIAIAAMALGGCKGKDPSKREPAAAPVPPAPTAYPPAAQTPAPPPPPPNPLDEPAKFLAGKPPALGCVAWSSRLKAVACVTGSIMNDEAQYELEQLGAVVAGPPVPLGALDDKAVATADAELVKGGYRPLGLRTKLADRKPVDVKSIAIVWQRNQTSAGGDNQAPSHVNLVLARCNGADVEMLRVETEGDDPTVTMYPAGDDVLVELKIRYAREGEHGEDFAAALIDPSTCLVTRTN